MKSPHNCPRFNTCNANLCPLDHDLKKRDWIPGEAVCKSRKWGRTRWIKKQRVLNKRTPLCWIEANMTISDLIAISRPMDLTPEQREILKIRMKTLIESQKKARSD